VVTSIGQPLAGEGHVSGTVTNSRGDFGSGATITVEHTIWYDPYVHATTNDNGKYELALVAHPAGDCTAKAQLTKSAYGHDYVFDLETRNNDPFNTGKWTTRNFI
jgi:hypothetical protein